ncbi:hypothetical protein IJ765_03805 [Candidatus Saccharibacteria bacterium]|nr:hypothetical protein [Candidatus Saccharibacteria bacterium]
MEKMFGAVKLEDLEKTTTDTPNEETPKMGAVKLEESPDEKPADTPDDAPADVPKMGEQKEAPKPVETFVPKIPGANKESETAESKDKGLGATSFQMDMMVEADEETGSSQGIFSGAKEAPKAVTPIRSAIFQQDDVNFKGKTATHAETVFDTDTSIKEEQREKEKAVEEEKSAEAGAKRTNKAWGVGTGDATVEAAETAKAEVEKIKAGKTVEEKPAEQAPVVSAKTEATPEPENANAGIFTAKPAKGSFINKIFGNIQAIFNKPIGKPKEEK